MEEHKKDECDASVGLCFVAKENVSVFLYHTGTRVEG